MQSVQKYVAVGSIATVPKELELSKPVQHQHLMQGRQTNVINSVSANSYLPGATIQIPWVEAEDWLIPSSAFVRFTVSFVRGANTMTLATFPYGGMGCFDDVECKLGGSQVEYVRYNRDINELLSAQIVSYDTRQFAGTYAIGIGRAVAAADGAVKTTTFDVPLSQFFGFFRSDKLFPLRNLRSGNSINLTVASANSTIKYNGAGGVNAGSYNISNVRIFYDSVKLEQGIDRDLANAIASENMKIVYPIKTYTTLESSANLALGPSALNMNAKASARYLNGVMLWFKSAGGDTATSLINPKQYPSGKLTNLRMSVNGRQILSDVDYLENVQALSSHTRKCLGLHGNSVDPHGWVTYGQYSADQAVVADGAADREDNAQFFMFYHNFAQSLEHNDEVSDTYDFSGDGSIVFVGQSNAAAVANAFVTLEHEKYIVLGGNRMTIME